MLELQQAIIEPNIRSKTIKDAEEELPFELKLGMQIHLVGIGGAGISAIARVLLGRGFVVSGSDQQNNALTAALEEAGATIYQGHSAAHVEGAQVVVISSAIPESNPEVSAARDAGIPVLKRSDFLGALMADKIGIAVAGTHGKTTTTGMITQMLLHAEKDPTVILGGVLPSLGTNGRFGESPYFIIEADEYDNMFLGLKPELSVITNMEHDHPDIFPTWEAYESAYRQFASLLPKDGRLILCGDDSGAQKLLSDLKVDVTEITTYGISENTTVDYRALDIRPNNIGGSDFLVETQGEILGLLRLRVPGDHNVLNGLAALIVGLDVGLDFIDIQRGLAEFGGVERRFQQLGEVNSVTIIDDYAHHPTEIKVNLAAAKQQFPGRQIWAVWQPHTFSRTKLLEAEFKQCFTDADRLVVLDIYRSRETDDLGIDMPDFVAAIEHPKVAFVPERETAVSYILDRIKPNDVVLTLGAGDGNMVGQWLLEALQKR
ncbi:MAG: UDP-N-acetylmuramate--L-alanine ligase [Chloroflexota bacterium]